ncbi:MAG: ABC transporter permease [Oscillospiraceae bacterium]|nr:ABC transporter permease [Oscillospiraceae bacterium]
MTIYTTHIQHRQDTQSFGKKVLKVLGKQKALVAIAVILIAMLFSSTNIFTLSHLRAFLLVASPELVIAFGVTFAVICRACDLSVGSVMSLSGIIAVQMINSGVPVFLAVLMAILSGSVIGFINGFLIVKQKTEAFIITLGMGLLLHGVALYISNGRPVSTRDPIFNAISNTNIPIPVIGYLPSIVVWMLLVGVITFCILRYTSFGRNCYALGGDYEVAEHSGINVVGTKWTAFVITGTCAAIAGVLLSSRFNTGSAVFGELTPLIVNCSVVIGGTSFAGGIGGIVQSGLGVLVMHMLRYGLSMFSIEGAFVSINQFVQTLVIGIVIVSIIAMDCYAIKRKKEDV